MSVSSGLLQEHPELDSDLEEADVRITPHILHAAKSGLSKLLFSLQTQNDVFVVAMYYAHLFVSKGLTELWLRGGVGVKTRYTPIHVLGDHVCNVLPAVHEFTGCDITII